MVSFIFLRYPCKIQDIIAQPDGKVLWLAKRFFPETYLKVLSFGYRKIFYKKFLEG